MKNNDLQIIKDIYRTTTDPGAWSAVLASLANAFDGNLAFISCLGQGSHHEPFYHGYNLPPEASVSYGEYYYQYDVWSPGWIKSDFHKAGKVMTGDQFVERSKLIKSVWYNEYLVPCDVGHAMFAPLNDKSLSYPLPPTIVSVDRPLRFESFSHADTERFQEFAEHLSRAFAIQLRFRELENGLGANETALDALQRGIMTLNGDGKIFYANRTAIAFLNKQSGLSVEAGKLCAIDTRGNAILRRIIKLARNGIAKTMLFVRPNLSPLMLQVMPLGFQQSPGPLACNKEENKILLLLTDEAKMQANANEAFAEAYHLTPREGEVLTALAVGQSLREIAEMHRVSFNTVRSQLASLMNKTDTQSQKNLVALYLGWRS